MSGHFLTISPLRSALPIHDVNIHKVNFTAGNNTSRARRINLQDEYSNNWDVADFLGGSHDVTYSKSTLYAPIQYIGGIAERKSYPRFAYSSRHRPGARWRWRKNIKHWVFFTWFLFYGYLNILKKLRWNADKQRKKNHSRKNHYSQ